MSRNFLHPIGRLRMNPDIGEQAATGEMAVWAATSNIRDWLRERGELKERGSLRQESYSSLPMQSTKAASSTAHHLRGELTFTAVRGSSGPLARPAQGDPQRFRASCEQGTQHDRALGHFHPIPLPSSF